MLKKEKYQEVEMEVIEFLVQDVISTSNSEDGPVILPDDEV